MADPGESKQIPRMAGAIPLDHEVKEGTSLGDILRAEASGINPICSICYKPGCSYLNHMVKAVKSVDVQPAVGILQQAAEITEVRQGEYGEPKLHFQNVANAWEAIIHAKVTPEQVILCMIALKILREVNQHKHDNLVDIAGYTRLLERVRE